MRFSSAKITTMKFVGDINSQVTVPFRKVKGAKFSYQCTFVKIFAAQYFQDEILKTSFNTISSHSRRNRKRARL